MSTPSHRQTRRPAATVVVMAGGKGERLWPLVRARTPKVCLSPDGIRSLLEATIRRVRPVWPGADWLIVTTHGQEASVRACLPAGLRAKLLVEPQIKNTAACITLAAVAIARHEPQRMMVVVPADHWVGDVAVFQRSLRTAIRAAWAHDTIVMIGVRPSHPHPGLGYLSAGAPLVGWRRPRVFRLARFVEKPSPRHARALLRRPRTYWNSGIFIGTAEKFIECVNDWLPEHARCFAALAQGLASDGVLSPRATKVYQAVKAVSFDHGVMDHLTEGLVVEGRFSWADLGSWDAWARVGRRAVRTIALNSRNISVIGRPDHLVATIGVDDLVIVHSPSATLICRPHLTHRVRELVHRLSADARLAPYR